MTNTDPTRGAKLRQSAFLEPGAFLKGALHCHTTRSDGTLSPEEALCLYKQYGFDFVAITDHRRYNRRNFAPETGVLVIPGTEVDREIAGRSACFHIVALGGAEGCGSGYAHDHVFAHGEVADAAQMQPVLDELQGNGNITVYCHPEWSRTIAREFEALRGNFAIEVYNHDCALHCDCDMDAPCWDELLGQGQRIYGVATDDGHRPAEFGGGWVCVKAERNVDSVLAALSRGAFYSSCGPQIHDFYIEDGQVVLECSPCRRIAFKSRYFTGHAVDAADAHGLTRASIPLPPHVGYMRAEVVDALGRRAWTNPIFLG